MTTSESTLGTLGNRLVQDLRTAQADRGLRASGKSAKSLSFSVVRNGQKITLTLTGASYWRFQENGRGPNSKKGRPSTAFVDIIRQWIIAKGISIPLSAAGAIATKITREGIKVPNQFNRGGVLSEPLNKDRIKGLLIPDLKAEFLKDVKSELFKP